MGSEDFAYMMAEVPGAYILVGNGEGEAGGCEVHNPHYDFNDAAIPYGAGILAAVVERELAPMKG
jgi:hippurate hydrolase